MQAYNFAAEAFRRDVEASLPQGTPKDKAEEVLESVVEAFVESFQYSRTHRRPFESLDRHESFWRGTGELDLAIDEAREVVGVPDDDEEDAE